MESKEAYDIALEHLGKVAKAIQNAQKSWGKSPDQAFSALRAGIDGVLNAALTELETTAKAVEADNANAAGVLRQIQAKLAEYKAVLPSDEVKRDEGITYLFGNWERKLRQIIDIVTRHMKDAGENKDFKELAKNLAA